MVLFDGNVLDERRDASDAGRDERNSIETISGDVACGNLTILRECATTPNAQLSVTVIALTVNAARRPLGVPTKRMPSSKPVTVPPLISTWLNDPSARIPAWVAAVVWKSQTLGGFTPEIVWPARVKCTPLAAITTPSPLHGPKSPVSS